EDAAAEAAAEAARVDAATAITTAEFLEGWRFDVDATKYFYPGSAKQRLRDKLHTMRKAMQADDWAHEAETGECLRCGERASGAGLDRLAARRAKEQADEAEFADDNLPVD
ncbi:MAG: hypothetical protein KKB78_12675, partial [Alphaproteobacteria bacterium]|nr:hypothetical protein [Alphaproteobacteria bacterium]